MKLIKCKDCHRAFYFQSQHIHLQCEPFQSKDGNEYIEIIELGVTCQHCQKWQHVAYVNEELLERQKNLTNNRQRRAFGRDFDRWQVEVRGVLAEPEEV